MKADDTDALKKVAGTFGEDRAPSYNPSVTNDPALANDEAAALAAIEGMSVIEMIGELLAAAAAYLERRLGGPGALRRLLSILIAFVTFIMTVMVRGRTRLRLHVPEASRILRYLRCPPSRWAGA